MIKKIALGLVTFAMAFSLVGCAGFDDVEQTYPLHQIVLGDQTDMNGTYFLIAAGIGKHKNAYYQFYVESPDGTIAYHKNKAEDVNIRLIDEGKAPFIKCEGNRMDIQPDSRFSFSGSGTNYYCVFNLPKSAIGTNVDVDLKNVQ